MKCSIIISTYNGENYITEQLQSIRQQTCQPDEVLIFDDCSTDNTVKIIRSFITDNLLNGWELTINKSNKGWMKNFIDGLSMVNGDLIFLCDQDDIWMPEKISKTKEIMAQNNKIELLISNYIKFYENGNEKIGFNIPTLIKRIDLDASFMDIKCPGCCYCVRKNLVDMCIPYWQKDFPHDALFWRTAIFRQTAYLYKYPLIKWRQHKNSTFAVQSRINRNLKSKLIWFEYANRYIDSIYKMIDNRLILENYHTIETLEKVTDWLDVRERFMKTKNVLLGIKLIKYREQYVDIKQYLGDWYFTFIKRE